MSDSSISTRLSRRGFAIAALPGVLLFMSLGLLALHMHRSLNGWPATIGTRGFPDSLLLHCTIHGIFFVILFYSIMILPVPILITLLVERWRHFAAYLAVYAASLLLFFGLFWLVVPEKFLKWWWD
jgi:hypothetical protein